ncbi:MAG: hypothetical protein IKO41_21430 [Lachnospiraceae bacterium]|nr:hypothetical protein [Lachnospiraceae bacterium]
MLSSDPNAKYSTSNPVTYINQMYRKIAGTYDETFNTFEKFYNWIMKNENFQKRLANPEIYKGSLRRISTFKPHSATNSYYSIKMKKNNEVAAKAKELLEQQPPVDVLYLDESDSELNVAQAVNEVADAISEVGRKCERELDTIRGLKQYDLTEVVQRLDKICGFLERIVYDLKKRDFENSNNKGRTDRDYTFYYPR